MNNWHVNTYQHYDMIVDGSETRSDTIAHVRKDVAALMVAAPDLLASLTEFVELYEGTIHMLGSSVKEKLMRAQVAIAKAKGQLP